MIAIGTRLGAYQILSLLGQGGMGEVYRATDTRLNRDVALKFLPEQFTSDRDRMERFQREAHVLASLNHSNIAAIYGLEDWGPTRTLVGDGNLMSVDVTLSPSFKAGLPKVLFQVPIFGGGATLDRHRWDLTADGQRFLINTSSLDESSPIAVVVNW